MAIVFEQQKKPLNWIRVLFIVFIVGFIVFALYYLFFQPTPKLDILLPVELQSTSVLSEIDFVEPSALLNSTEFLSLRIHGGVLSPGALGRSNPFLPI